MAAVLDEVGKPTIKLVDEEPEDIVDDEDESSPVDAAKKKKKKKKKKKPCMYIFLFYFASMFIFRCRFKKQRVKSGILLVELQYLINIHETTFTPVYFSGEIKFCFGG